MIILIGAIYMRIAHEQFINLQRQKNNRFVVVSTGVKILNTLGPPHSHKAISSC